jgi:glycosyltransferase involved in cell wall biosynthesis
MDKLKIVIIADWFSENMGYAENFLPKALAELGHDVHLVTSTAQVYYNSPSYDKTYRPFLGPNIVKEGVTRLDGYTLHRLQLASNKSGVLIIKGLSDYLNKLKPQVIQTFSVNSLTTYQAAKYCHKNDCKLFTESHVHASVFSASVAQKINISIKKIRKFILGRNIFKFILDLSRSHLNQKKLKFINEITQMCYPIAPDAARIVENYYYVSNNKIKVQSLGVDTDLFHPASSLFLNEERGKSRTQLGLRNDSLVCIYTGRFTRDKKPQCLARAVDYLQNQGENIQALFVGNGTADEIKEIAAMKGCLVHKFVQVKELPKLYWLADIGVWPSQESTSQLDAAACGLPLILSDHIEVKERVDGNGLLYDEDNEIDLAEKIRLLQNIPLRQKMSSIGAENVKNKFSWRAIAQERVKDYYKVLAK